MEHDKEIDTTGLLCPLPVLKAQKALLMLQSRQILLIYADDPTSVVDIPHFCKEQGHNLIAQNRCTKFYKFFVQKK